MGDQLREGFALGVELRYLELVKANLNLRKTVFSRESKGEVVASFTVLVAGYAL